MLSKRERSIAIFTGAALGLAGLFYGYDWVQGQFDDLEHQKTELSKATEEAKNTLKQDKDATKQWKQFVAQGLTQDATSAESGLLNAMEGDWSQAAGLPLNSIQTDRASVSHGLHDLAFEARADGSMRSIANFLYRVETTGIPVRIRELQLSARKEGTDDLTMALRLSTFWDDPHAIPEKAPAPVKEDQP